MERGAPTLATVLARLSASPDGLTSAEAGARLARYGTNRPAVGRAEHPLALVWRQFRSPLVLILLIAAALSFALGQMREALIVAAIVLASAGLGFWQEFRAGSAIAALERRLSVIVRARRDGKLLEVPLADVVPGDVVHLAAGSLVPADAIVISAHELHVDEAALTGESLPVRKAACMPDAEPGGPNQLHMGTSVRSGEGEALVVATGAGTDFGAIAVSAARLQPETSFARGIRGFGLLMTQVMFVLVTLVLVANVLLGRPVLDSLLFAAALAVGLTPELLPAVVTVTLTQGARRLAARGVLVRRLAAIEDLGAMDVLCTDKTGTLTEGTVRLERALDCSGTAAPAVLHLAALNARLQSGMPNPIDEALVAAAPHIDDDARKLGEVPYEFERRRLSVLVELADGPVLICKGSVEAVLSACVQIADPTGPAPMTETRRTEELARARAWSAQGLRVLAVATRRGPDMPPTADDERDLMLEGYVCFADPLKAGIAETVAALAERGVTLKIVTGDNRHVAAHIAGAVGLAPRRLLTGAQIAPMSQRALVRRAAHADVFAEVTPSQKERIVTALRQGGRTVGYLGDGINDAPPLRAADAGISVDSAVDAARAAADIVLLERDLDVLLAGIVAGRTALGNTLKYITITVSANLGNMVSMAAASLLLPFLPLLATQILLNNSLSDLPMLAISTDRMDADALMRPRRWDLRALLRAMLAFGLMSSAFDALTFLVLLGGFSANEPLFQTGWFIESLLTELAVVAVMRTRHAFFRSPPSLLLTAASIGVAAVAITLPYIPPLAAALGFVPLPLPVIVALGAITLGYVAATELLKRPLNAFGTVTPADRGSRGAGRRPRRPQ